MRVVGVNNDLRKRRRLLARTISHRGMKTTLEKGRGTRAETSFEDFLRPVSSATGPVTPPRFVQDLAKAFADAQAKRHEADYDMNKVLSERDARLLRVRVNRVIAACRAARRTVMAKTAADVAKRVCKPLPAATGAGPKSPDSAMVWLGGRCRARTYDPLIKSQLLYQLS